MLNQSTKIYVAGHQGLVGSALVAELQKKGYQHLILRTRTDCDLLNTEQVAHLFQTEQPEVVFLAAAKVGGILANHQFPADFIYQNLQIELNVIHQAFLSGVKKLIFLGSSCIYPKFCPQPMQETHLLSGDLEPTNRSYAIAKIAGIELCWAYNRQYQTQYLAVMPTNLFGPCDNYDLHTSHVIPALIHKIDTAKRNNSQQVTLWGTGTPRREFLYSPDLAAACVHLMELPSVALHAVLDNAEHPPLINVGYGCDVTILELAHLLAEVIGYTGSFVFDTTRPDGTPQKLLDCSKIHALGWRPQYDLRAALTETYANFCETQCVT